MPWRSRLALVTLAVLVGMAAVLGEPLKRPDGRAVREITGYAIGGIPPLGFSAPMPTVIDEKLLEFDTVWAAAGTPRCVFSVDPKGLAAATNAHRHAF